MKQTAKLNYLRIAPRKVRLTADLVKGLPVNEAEAQLMLIRKRPAGALLKLLRSAVANAKNNKKFNEELLFVESIKVDGGPMLKRYLPRARGTATPIQKKLSHVTIVLAEKSELKPRFKIVVPKKVKLPPGETRRPKKKDKMEKIKESAKPKKPGFFQKLFRRKAV